MRVHVDEIKLRFFSSICKETAQEMEGKREEHHAAKMIESRGMIKNVAAITCMCSRVTLTVAPRGCFCNGEREQADGRVEVPRRLVPSFDGSLLEGAYLKKRVACC